MARRQAICSHALVHENRGCVLIFGTDVVGGFQIKGVGGMSWGGFSDLVSLVVKKQMAYFPLWLISISPLQPLNARIFHRTFSPRPPLEVGSIPQLRVPLASLDAVCQRHHRHAACHGC
jgi:hypothetical protein